MEKQTLIPHTLHTTPRPGDREVCFPSGAPPAQRAQGEEAAHVIR